VAFERKVNQNAPEQMVEVMAAMGTRPSADGTLVAKQDPYFFQRWPFRRDDRWEELRGLTVPVLVVHAEDSFIPAETAHRMAQEIPNSRLVTIVSSGHVVPAEQPAELGSALRTFFGES
jgi:pimeloyl-ACP methyl ester carboxylesterase